MSSALLVEESYKRILTPSAFIIFGLLIILGKEFEGRERRDAIFLSQRLVGGSIGIHVCNNTLETQSTVYL
jgi:hypothetical protein